MPTPSLFDTVETGDLAGLQAALRQQPGAVLAARDRNNASLLHEAAYCGECGLATALLEAQADLDQHEDIYGDTPLHTAAAKAADPDPELARKCYSLIA